MTCSFRFLNGLAWAALLMCGSLFAPQPASATTFTMVVRSGEVLPGASQALDNFGGYVSWSMRDGVVGYLATASGTHLGVYRWTRDQGNVAMALPGAEIFPGEVISNNGFGSSTGVLNGEVYTTVMTDPGFQFALCRCDGTTITRVIGRGDPIPALSRTLLSFSSGGFNLDSSGIVFEAVDNQSTLSILNYDWTTIRSIIQTGTPIPDTNETFSNISGFGPPSISQGRIVFSGRGSTLATQGVYLWDNGSLTTIADTNTLALDTGTSLTDFASRPAMIYGHTIALSATRDGESAVYRVSNGALNLVAEADTHYPGVGTLGFIRQFVAVHGSHIAFTSQKGAWVSVGSQLIPILQTGTTFDGKTVSQTRINGRSLEFNRLLMHVVFSDDSSGLYIAEDFLPTAAEGWELYD